MGSVWKITKGELYKLIKSKSMLIMSILLACTVAIMSVVYAFQSDNLGLAMDMMFGDSTRIDAFDILDGNLDPIREVAGLIPGFDLTELEKTSEQLKDKPNIKVALLNVDNVILQALAMCKTPSIPGLIDSPLYGIGNAEIRDALSNFGSYSTIQTMVTQSYYQEYITSDKYLNARLTDLMEYLKNPVTNDAGEIEYTYGRTIVDYIVLQMEMFEDAFISLNAAFQAQKAAPTEANYESLRSAYYDFAMLSSTVNYFTRSSMMSTNFLLVPTEGFQSEAYNTLRTALKPFSDKNYNETVTSYNTIMSDYKNDLNARQFRLDFQSMYTSNALSDEKAEDKGFPMNPTTNTGKDSPYKKFMDGLNKLLTETAVAENTLFYYHNDDVAAMAERWLAGETLPEADARKAKEYVEAFGGGKDESGETVAVDSLKPYRAAVNTSYKGEITKEVYDAEYRPFYDDKEKAALAQFESDMTEQKNRYHAVHLVFGMLDSDEMDLGAYVAPETDFAKLYAQMKNTFKQYDSRTQTINKLIINVNLLESINANNLKDSDAKKIQGFLLSSRYKLQSNITQTQFLIANDYLATDYIAPEKMGGGYGYMQFVFILSSVVILVFGIVLAAGAIAGEHSGGTMKLLLIRPHRRWQVMIGKFLAILIVLVGLYIINFALTAALGFIWGYPSAMALSIVNSTNAVVMHPLFVLFLYHIFGLLEAVIFAQIALSLSTVIKSRSGAVSVSMLVYFVSYVLSSLLSSFTWYKFVIFNNTNLTQYISSQGPALADMNLGFSLIVNLIYIVALAVLSLVTFQKRDAS